MSDTPAQSHGTNLAQTVRKAHEDLSQQIGKVIVGQTEVIDQMLIALFCQGHALLVGVPGLAKTLLVSTISRALNLDFNRIQFTPDLMPSDITGTEVIDEDKATGRRELRFVKGPVFANVLLADEINRTPPKTQAALLEAMQEKQVTAGGAKHRLPQPFFVLATQNPVEQEGTYPLPEAQLDRFMFNIKVSYPSENEEFDIVRQTTAQTDVTVDAVLDADQIMEIQRFIRNVPAADHVIRYALKLVRHTRISEKDESRPEFIDQYLSWGAGPRASQYLVLAGKARAVINGRSHVDVEDIRAIAHPVLRHRLITNFNAEADGLEIDDLITRLLDETSPDGLGGSAGRELDNALRQ